MSPVTASRPGIAGRGYRRLASASVAGVGLLNVVLAARRRLFFHLGPVHGYVPHAAVQGSRYALLAAGVAMLASTGGLLHGKRQAWLIAVIATAVALIAHPFKRVDFVGVLANGSALAILAPFVQMFPARSDPVRARQGVIWLLVGELGVFIYGVLGLYLLDRHFAGDTTLADSLEDASRLLFVLPPSTIEPTTRHGAWFIDSVRVSAVCILLVSSYHLLHPVIHRSTVGRGERRRVEQILEAYGQTTLAYFHLLPDKSYFFATEGEAFIGYRVVGHAAVALGEPIGEAAARLRVVSEFAEFCDLNGWTFCFHQVTEEGAEELARSGLQALKIGEEAIIDCETFTLAGRSFKHVRNELNRLTLDGFRVEFLDPPLSADLTAELEEISAQWLSAGGHRERAFTLGAFSREYVTATPVAVVRAANGRIEAFVNIIPSFRGACGNFDMMRRRPDSPDGAMDALIVALVEHFRATGYRRMALGMAPLANIEGTGVLQSALRLLYAHGSATFRFEGIRAFKEKWHPSWEARYLCYRSDVQLPVLAVAVARAGELSGGLPKIIPALPGIRSLHRERTS